jgi:hypothetical protein
VLARCSAFIRSRLDARHRRHRWLYGSVFFTLGVSRAGSPACRRTYGASRATCPGKSKALACKPGISGIRLRAERRHEPTIRGLCHGGSPRGSGKVNLFADAFHMTRMTHDDGFGLPRIPPAGMEGGEREDAAPCATEGVTDLLR